MGFLLFLNFSDAISYKKPCKIRKAKAERTETAPENP